METAWPAWSETWRDLGARTQSEDLHRQLIAAYTQPHRHYHSLQHLEECLQWRARIRSMTQEPAEIAIALWFHDAIYDVKATDNELRSAEWAHAALLQAGVAPEKAQRVHALIMATRHSAVPSGFDEQWLVDIDLSILGAPRERFDEYEQQIRQEYAYVPGFLFKRKRQQILQGFLDRPAIYSTAYFHAALEQRARANLMRVIG